MQALSGKLQLHIQDEMTPIFVSSGFVLKSLQSCHVLILHSPIGIGILRSAARMFDMRKVNLKGTVWLTK
jgi:hypothetical protein